MHELPTAIETPPVCNGSSHVVVTRHEGAASWVQAQLGFPVQRVTHLLPQAVVPGVSYYGVFPMSLAAVICAAGGHCWAISVAVPAAWRGQELSAAQLNDLGAVLLRFDVRVMQRLPDPTQGAGHQPAGSCP